MRIIAGRLGGLNFESPRGHKTHPMSDKIRGAIFNSLGDVDGLTILDAFTGSGALAYEAISRGASHALAVDVDRDAVETVRANIVNLNLTKRIKAIRANVSSWSDNNESKTFDIILVDPPYDKLQPKVIQKLVRHLDDNGIYVLSWPGDNEVPELGDVSLIKQKSYGDAQLAFYRKSS